MSAWWSQGGRGAGCRRGEAPAPGVPDGRRDPEAARVEARPGVAVAEERTASQQGEDGVGEQEDDEQVDQRRQAQGEGEATHARAGQREERQRREEVDAVGDQDGALGAVPAGLDRGGERTPVAQLVTHPLEVDDERVGGEADGDDQAGDAGHVEAVVVRPAQDRDGQVGHQAGDEDRGDGDEAQGAVLDQRVDDDEQEADQARDEAVAQLLAAQGGADVDAGLLDERQRQRTELELVGQAAGAVEGEATGDAGAAVEDGLVEAGRDDDLGVEGGGELVLRLGQRDHLAADLGVLLGALTVEGERDLDLVGDVALLVADVAGGGVGDLVAGDGHRAQDVLGRAVDVTGDQRLGRVVDDVLEGGRVAAVERLELGGAARG